MDKRLYYRLRAIGIFVGFLILLIAFGYFASKGSGLTMAAQLLAALVCVGIAAWKKSTATDIDGKIVLWDTVEWRFMTAALFIGGTLTYIVPRMLEIAWQFPKSSNERSLWMLGVVPLVLLVMLLFSLVKNQWLRILYAGWGVWCTVGAVQFLCR